MSGVVSMVGEKIVVMSGFTLQWSIQMRSAPATVMASPPQMY